MERREQVEPRQSKNYFSYGELGTSKAAISGIINPDNPLRMTIGVAKCHKNDVFKKSKARNIALGRATTHSQTREHRKGIESFEIVINAENPGKQFSEFAREYFN